MACLHRETKTIPPINPCIQIEIIWAHFTRFRPRHLLNKVPQYSPKLEVRTGQPTGGRMAFLPIATNPCKRLLLYLIIVIERPLDLLPIYMLICGLQLLRAGAGGRSRELRRWLAS